MLNPTNISVGPRIFLIKQPIVPGRSSSKFPVRLLHWLSIFLIFLVFYSLLASAHAATFDRIRQAGKIVIAHREASIPFSYYDDNKVPVGYAIDLCLLLTKAIKKELKLPDLRVEYMAITPATRIQAISEGKADLECGSTTNNAERRKSIAYTIPHFISSARFLVRSNAQVTNLEDLGGKTVVSTKGTTNIKTLQRLNEELVLRMKLVEAADHAQAFQMVSDGKADAFAMDDVLLYGLRANSGHPQDFKVTGKPMTIEPYAIMLQKNDPEFKKFIDKEMARIMTSREIYPIYKKWFESPIPPKGINMELEMPYLLRDYFRFPSDMVGDNF